MVRGDCPWADASELIPGQISMVFDVGANTGQTAKELSQTFPAAAIYSFEPVASTFADLERNTHGLGRVQCFQIGLSSSARAVDIHRQMDSGWNSVSKSIDRGLGKTTIRLETIDAFCLQRGIGRVNILKTDTEGHDLHVLKGAAKLLSEGAIDAIYCEVGFHCEDVGHTHFPAVLEYLQSHSFQFYGLYGLDGIKFVDHPVEPCYPWTNALFVRNALVQARYGEEYAIWLSSFQPNA
jgi:FkbM family methyltransferase